MAVTSQIAGPANPAGEIPITDWRKAGLLKASLIKPVFATIERGLILRKLGDLQEADKQALRRALSEVLG
jgi:mRNA interferase MazF